MVRELKYLETEFAYAVAERTPEQGKAGEDVRYLGRRLLELADEFLPKLKSSDWKRIAPKSESPR